MKRREQYIEIFSIATIGISIDRSYRNEIDQEKRSNEIMDKELVRITAYRFNYELGIFVIVLAIFPIGFLSISIKAQ